MVKNKVNVLHYDQEVKILCIERLYYVRRKIWDTWQARLLLWVFPTPFWFLPGSWFLVSSGFPAPGAWCLCSHVGVASNLRIPEFIDNSAQQQIVLVSCFFSAVNIEFTSVQDSLSITEWFLHLANRASFTVKTDLFWWGHGPDALACKARPSLTSVGLLWACHCHCPNSCHTALFASTLRCGTACCPTVDNLSSQWGLGGFEPRPALPIHVLLTLHQRPLGTHSSCWSFCHHSFSRLVGLGRLFQNLSCHRVEHLLTLWLLPTMWHQTPVFSKLLSHRLLINQSELLAPRSTLLHVPFHDRFRCCLEPVLIYAFKNSFVFLIVPTFSTQFFLFINPSSPTFRLIPQLNSQIFNTIWNPKSFVFSELQLFCWRNQLALTLLILLQSTTTSALFYQSHPWASKSLEALLCDQQNALLQKWAQHSTRPEAQYEEADTFTSFQEELLWWPATALPHIPRKPPSTDHWMQNIVRTRRKMPTCIGHAHIAFSCDCVHALAVSHTKMNAPWSGSSNL